jgi:hypothetical protein
MSGVERRTTMKNITLAVDEKVLDEAHAYAAKRETTLDALVREYLEGLVAEEARMAETRRRLSELIDNSAAELGPDYVWNREALYEDRMFPRHKHPDLRGSRKEA